METPKSLDLWFSNILYRYTTIRYRCRYDLVSPRCSEYGAGAIYFHLLPLYGPNVAEDSSTMEHLGLAATNTTSSGDTSDLRCRQLEKPTKIKLREGGTKLAVGQIRMVKDRFSRVVNWSVILV